MTHSMVDRWRPPLSGARSLTGNEVSAVCSDSAQFSGVCMYVCACICVYCCGTRMRPACLFRLDLCRQFPASDDMANAQIKDLETEICDFKESRIPDDDTFSSEDVRELIDSLQTSIRADAYRNLQRVAHRCVHRTPACARFKLFIACILHIFSRGWCQLMQQPRSTVVLLRQCMLQSAQLGSEVTLDTGMLEDERFLLEAKRIEEESERTPETKELAPAGAPIHVSVCIHARMCTRMHTSTSISTCML